MADRAGDGGGGCGGIPGEQADDALLRELDDSAGERGPGKQDIGLQQRDDERAADQHVRPDDGEGPGADRGGEPAGADDAAGGPEEDDHGDTGAGYAADRSDGGDDRGAAFGGYRQRGSDDFLQADPGDPDATFRAVEGDAGEAASGDGAQIAIYQVQAGEAATADEKERLDAKVTQYREIYSGLLQSYKSVRLSEAQTVSSVVQVERATPNFEHVRPKTMQNTLLAAVAGFLLAAGAIVARDTLDDTIKTPEEISRKFRLPILGVINHHHGEEGEPISIKEPHSPTAEAYRTLRTNVSYTGVDHPIRTILVTSSEPGEGKTTTLSNLAVAFAQNGKQVIVADCDMRHPRVHVNFRLNNRKGMSNLFSQSSYVLDGSCQPTGVDNLSIVTTGALPPNPAELLGSNKMQSILKAMVENADIVLLDTPPALAVTDAAVLASSVDGVLLVVRPGKTRVRALEQTLEQMKQVGARVLGVVINDVETHGSAYSLSI